MRTKVRLTQFILALTTTATQVFFLADDMLLLHDEAMQIVLTHDYLRDLSLKISNERG
jgi:hypothetical protein